ncbi:hypothetical protein D3C78_1701940 [compost metagenome]
MGKGAGQHIQINQGLMFARDLAQGLHVDVLDVARLVTCHGQRQRGGHAGCRIRGAAQARPLNAVPDRVDGRGFNAVNGFADSAEL